MLTAKGELQCPKDQILMEPMVSNAADLAINKAIIDHLNIEIQGEKELTIGKPPIQLREPSASLAEPSTLAEQSGNPTNPVPGDSVINKFSANFHQRSTSIAKKPKKFVPKSAQRTSKSINNMLQFNVQSPPVGGLYAQIK